MLTEAGEVGGEAVIYPVKPRYAHIEGRGLPSIADLRSRSTSSCSRNSGTGAEQHDGRRPRLPLGRDLRQRARKTAAGAARCAAGRRTSRHRGAIAAAASRVGRAVGGDGTLRFGCMGFANVSHGLRVMGYVEPDPLPQAPWPGHALGVGVLYDAAHAPGVRVLPGGFIRSWSPPPLHTFHMRSTGRRRR